MLQLPVLYSKTLSLIHSLCKSSRLLTLTCHSATVSLFSMSVTVSVSFVIFQIPRVISYDISIPEFTSYNTVWLQMALLHSFLRVSSIPLHVWTTSLFIHLAVDI